MNADAYQEGTKTTMVYPGRAALTYLALGVAGEGGEVANKVKKILRDGRQHPTDTENEDIIDELGDVLWYVAQLSGFLGVSLSMVMALNLEKLRVRKQMNTLKRRANG